MLPNDKTYDQVSMGARALCGRIASTKKLVCRGSTISAHLDNGRPDIAKEIPTDVAVDSVEVGSNHACTLAQGAVACYFTSMALADIKSVPAEVTGLNSVDLLQCGRYHCCARLASTKTMRCWGGKGKIPAYPLGSLQVSYIRGDSNAPWGCAVLSSDSTYECFGEMAVADVKREGCSANSEQSHCQANKFPVAYGKMGMAWTRILCVERSDTMQTKCYGNEADGIIASTPTMGPIDDIACGDNYCSAVETTGKLHHWGRYSIPDPLFPTDTTPLQ
jgi:hypothetical protein